MKSLKSVLAAAKILDLKAEKHKNMPMSDFVFEE